MFHLETDRLIIRPWQAEDRPAFAALTSDAAVMQYVHGGRRVVAIIDPDNEPSKRVAARLGMSYEARYTGAEFGHRNPEIVVDLFFRERL